MKTCTVCGREKSLGEFHTRRGNLDGHRNHCRKCRIESRKLHRHKIREERRLRNHEIKEEMYASKGPQRKDGFVVCV